MRYYRFMSKTEFINLMNGNEMINNTDFNKIGNKTNSVGFCFLSEKTNAKRNSQ